MEVLDIDKQTLSLQTPKGLIVYNHWGSGPLYACERFRQYVDINLTKEESEEANKLLKQTLKDYYKNAN